MSSPAAGAEPSLAGPVMAVESRLVRTLLDGEFAVTAEIAPPVAGGADSLRAKGQALKDLADAVNVTDGASAKVAMSSLAAAAILAADGVEPVLQCTCRDRNRIALQSDLLGAAALGVHNVLVLTGDDPKQGDQPDAKPVFDLKSQDVIRIAAEMRDKGVLPSGREIETPPRLFIGCADVPMDPKPGWKPDGLRQKAELGAQFVQTQLNWDLGVIKRWIGRLNDDGLTDRLFVLIGIGPLASARSARWMRDNLFGVNVPDAIIDRLEKAKDAKKEGIAICAELMQQLAEVKGIAGVHLMAPVNPSDIPAAIEASGVLTRRAKIV
jgi:methylenetetrahydrofolate reductase (NADPH)